MLFRVLKRMIERGQIEGLSDKIDVFYAANRLTGSEYTELTSLLSSNE